MEPSNHVTQLLEQARAGDADASSTLLPLVYNELRALAGSMSGPSSHGRTLQPTALVHEAYAKLVASQDRRWESRRHFFEVAAKAMRQLLANHARDSRRQKRGGGWERVPLEGIDLPGTRTDYADLDEALHRLGALNERHARVVELRFFAGLSVEETANVIGVSPRTVEQDWKLARAFLRRTLKEDGLDDP